MKITRGDVMDKNGAVGSVKRGLWITFLLFSLISLPFVRDVPAQEEIIANAGPDQTANENEEVLLDGSGSEGDGAPSWTQIGGTQVITGTIPGVTITFTAPNIAIDDPIQLPLTFQLTVAGEIAEDTDLVNVYVFDSDRVVSHTVYLDQPYGISVSPGNLIGFAVTGTDAITNTITGIVPNVWNGAMFDTVISGTTSSTVTLFFDNPVPPGYDLWRLSRSQSEWSDLSGFSNFNPGRSAVSWTSIDNDPLFDDDFVTGTINDPAAMASPPGGLTPATDDGGCFIGTVADGPGM
jgi:hypothetical protein